MDILHISDTHVGPPTFFDEQLLLNTIDSINNSNYDLVIHSGDVTQGGGKEEYEKAKQIFDTIKKPFIVFPGNHDSRSGGLYLFEQYIGNTDGYMEIGEAIIIYVNSAIADSDDGRVGRVKFNFIRETLYKFQRYPIKILALHHHILPVPMSGRERNVLYNAGDILDLINRTDVDLVLLGHKHYPNIYKVENTLFVNAGTVSGKKTRYGDKNSYNSIHVNEKEKCVSVKRINGESITKRYPRKYKRIYSDFGKKRMRIVHLSNSLISPERVFIEKCFTNARKTIEEMQPDLIVHCGGIVHEGIQQDYDLAVRHFSRFSTQIVYSPAGRDINYLGYHLYNTYFGEMDQSFSNGFASFQGISSSQYDSSVGIVGRTGRISLLNRLQESEEDFKAAFFHHNILPIPHSRNKGLLEDSGDLLKELVEANIDLVLTGTSSHPYAAKVDNTLVVNANSLSSMYQRSTRGNSFNLIDIYEKTIAVFEVNSIWGTRRLLGIWDRLSTNCNGE